MDRDRRLRVLLIDAKAPLVRALMELPELEVTVLCGSAQHGWYEESGCGEALAELSYVAGEKLDPRSIRSVRRAIVHLDPDLVHAFYPKALAHTVVATLGMKARPRVVSYRGITAPAPWWDPVEWVTYRSRRVDAQACESEAVRDALVRSGVPRGLCGVVYNCLNGPLLGMQRDTARRAWRVPADAFVVVMAANMRPVKGADILVQAALECLDLAGVHYVLMGNVHDERVRWLAADPRLKRTLHLVGYHPNAASLVSAADVFVMPSRAEALSVALLEAMAHGVCPVVSDAGGMKEAVRDGQDGLVFPSEDTAALAQCIRRLHQDDVLRTQLAASARQRIAEAFSPGAMAGRLVRLYYQVMGMPARGEGIVRKAA